jgi:hypothetical protein
MTQTTVNTSTPSAPTEESPKGNYASDANRRAQSRRDAKDTNRCTFRFPNGKRCKLLILDSHSRLCFHHAKLQLDQRDLADLSADLLGDQPAEFKTPEQINDLLSRVVVLLAQGRISPRRAAVLTFAGSLLLRSVVVMDRRSSEEGQPPTIIWDLPRPDRSCSNEDETDPVPQIETTNQP